ncbi:hypothetical protein RZS08_64180, partial [Arthrospira platensis SPKY1]|nr:hypothetical protein [Arthrospira platensis SPKY1]
MPREGSGVAGGGRRRHRQAVLENRTEAPCERGRIGNRFTLDDSCQVQQQMGGIGHNPLAPIRLGRGQRGQAPDQWMARVDLQDPQGR